MTCVHFLPNVPVQGQPGLGSSSGRADMCELLRTTEVKHEEYREVLRAKGFTPVPDFACPFSSGGRWKVCPHYGKPGKRGHRRR